jgi:hypothetical protein
MVPSSPSNVNLLLVLQLSHAAFAAAGTSFILLHP